MTKFGFITHVSGLVIGGRSDVTTLEPLSKGWIKPCAIRDYPMLERRLFLNESAY